MYISALLVIFLWTFAPNVSAAVAFVVVFGIMSGAVIGLPPASVANILGKNKTRQTKLGQWTGMMYTVAAPFALTGPVIAGHLITEYDTYVTVQLWSGCSLFIAAICLTLGVWELHKMELRRSPSTATARSVTSTLVALEKDDASQKGSPGDNRDNSVANIEKDRAEAIER